MAIDNVKLFEKIRQDLRNAHEKYILSKILSPTVHLLDSDGKDLGIIPTGEALDLAWRTGAGLKITDLNSNPPTCSIAPKIIPKSPDR